MKINLFGDEEAQDTMNKAAEFMTIIAKKFSADEVPRFLKTE